MDESIKFKNLFTQYCGYEETHVLLVVALSECDVVNKLHEVTGLTAVNEAQTFVTVATLSFCVSFNEFFRARDHSQRFPVCTSVCIYACVHTRESV